MTVVYVYRLDVQYPEGSRFDPERPEDKGWMTWEPDTWEPLQEGHTFTWPKRRHYLSGSAGNERKRLLECWGATVSVVRSLPVMFPSVDDEELGAYCDDHGFEADDERCESNI